MTPPFRARPKPLLACLAASAALLALSACSSDRADRRDRGGDPGAPGADRTGPEMAAKASFFSSQLDIEVLLNRAGFGTHDSGSSEATSAKSTPDSSSSDMLPVGPAALSGPAAADAASSNVNGPGASDSARGTGHRHGGGSQGSPAGATRADGDAGTPMHGSNLTAVSFHVRLFNHASYPVEVEVLDFNSDLGDFVVEPEKILIQANASAETEPMTSRLGVTSDAIPLTVTIRYKGQAPTHAREKQVLVLKPVPAPAPNPMSPPPLRFN